MVTMISSLPVALSDSNETMNEDQHHDLERGKLRASLNWLIAKAFCDKIPTLYADLFLEDAKGFWYLKPQVIRALTSGELYCAACTHLFADKEAAWTDHALVISHLWQRRGVRAVEKSGQPVQEAALKKDSPFHSAAHLGLVDAIMRAYMSQVTDVPRVMREISRVYPFTGPDSPPNLDEGLELWLSCVAETVLERRVPLRDANHRQARVRLLVEGMRFPTRLACMLRFYSAGLQEAGDLIGSTPLQDLSAVEAHCDLVLDFCRRMKSSGTVLHLDRLQLSRLPPDLGLLRLNLLCLLAELFLVLPQLQTAQSQELPNFRLSTRHNTRAQQLGALFRPSSFSEPLMPGPLRPAKERLTPEVSKAVESGEEAGFRARADPRCPISSGTFRIPKSRSRDGVADDDEFTTPNEEPQSSTSAPGPSLPINEAGDSRMTFAQFLAMQRQQKKENDVLQPVEPLPDPPAPRSLKEEFERKKKERGVKKTTFAPLPNQTTWAAQQRRRQSDTASQDSGGGDSDRGSSSSLLAAPNFTDTKIKIEQKKRQIKAELKRADAKLRQMREEENKKIFQQMCMKAEKKEEETEKEKKEEEVQEEEEVETETKKKEEETEKAVEKDQAPEKSEEVAHLQEEVEVMRKEKEDLKRLLMQLQRQQDSFQAQQARQLEQIQQRHMEQQAELRAKQEEQEASLRQRELELEMERDRLRTTSVEGPPRSESPVPSEGSQTEYNVYDKFSQSLSELQQDISKLSLQQEFMNQTIKERLQDGPKPAWPSPGLPGEMNGQDDSSASFFVSFGDGQKPKGPRKGRSSSSASSESTPSVSHQEIKNNSLPREMSLPPPPEPQRVSVPPPPEPQRVSVPPPPEPQRVSVPPPPEPQRVSVPPLPELQNVSIPPPQPRHTSMPPTPPEPKQVTVPPPEPAIVKAPAAFVMDESAKGLCQEELNKRKEKFIAMQKRKQKEREAERLEKRDTEREREQAVRQAEKEAQDVKKARDKEKRDRLFQTPLGELRKEEEGGTALKMKKPPKRNYLERKTEEEEEERRKTVPRRGAQSRTSRPHASHSPAPSPISHPSRNRSAGPSIAARPTATPSPLALNLAADPAPSGSVRYEYQGLGSTTVRLSAHSRPSLSSRDREASAAAAPTEYNGPRLFKQPKERSNRSVIVNAINHCLLPGVVNKDVRATVLEDLQKAEGTTFMVLFRNRSCQYRGLYTFHQEFEDLTRFAGSGPKKVRNQDVVDFFKYDSGAKKFALIDTTKHLSPVIDAFTIDNKLWKKGGARPSGQVAPSSSPAATGGYSRRH